MNKKDNARSRDTDERIIRALYALLGKYKTLAKVTVREICELAEINRSTFYAHYVDVYDVIEKVENHMEQQMTETFLKSLESGTNISDGYIGMFEFIANYREFYKIYLSETNHPVIGIARELYQSRLATSEHLSALGFTDPEELAYQEDFFISGLSAMIRRWVANDCKHTPQQLMDMIGHQYSRANLEIFDWGDKKDTDI